MSGIMTDIDDITDRRVRRTRRALIEAFNTLVTSRRYEDIKVSDIIEAADVGRSTFYEHYSGREAIHRDALAAPMSILADAACGRGDAARLTSLLEHFWDNRALARSTLSGPQGKGAVRLLADQITDRLSEREGQTPFRSGWLRCNWQRAISAWSGPGPPARLRRHPTSWPRSSSRVRKRRWTPCSNRRLNPETGPASG